MLLRPIFGSMSRKLLIILLLSAVALISSVLVFTAYRFIYSNNVQDHPSGNWELLIPTGSTYADVERILSDKGMIRNSVSFGLIARRMKYDKYVKPGRFIIPNESSNYSMIKKLRSGKQDPVKLVLNNINGIDELTKKVAERLECTSDDLMKLLMSNAFLQENNLNRDNVLTFAIANTYEFYWNTSAEGFANRMLKESKRFWNEKRLEQARKSGLSTSEVIILASIVQKESNKVNEYPDIAGVYLNRLKRNWPLQADPTVKFALGQPELKRILKVHTEFDSPYNTYKYSGLPPGPVCLPEIYAIDAVLNARQHEYMFFCAKDDFSGYHAFAKTLGEHNENARRYHRALNERKIF
jgi:UPF0755 protein